MPQSPTSLQLDSMRNRVAALAAGGLFLLAFAGLSQSVVGLEIQFAGNWADSTPGELYTWLGLVLLLTPGGLLVGWGAVPWLKDVVGPALSAIRELDRREQLASLVAVGSGWMLLSRLGRLFVLRDYPVTDDEWAVRLGGQVLASGQFMAPIPSGWKTYSKMYLYTRDGMYTSFDWVGTQLVWALGELTGTTPILFALLATVPLVCLAVVVANQLDALWGAVGVFLLAVSPMFVTLSWTSHAHLVSRAWVAATILCFCLGDTDGRMRWWVGMGLAFGGGVLTRPVEILLLTSPLFGYLGWRAVTRRTREAWAPLVGIVVGGLLPAAIFLLHNTFVTSAPLEPARFADTGKRFTMGSVSDHFEAPLAVFSDPTLAWERFGANTAYNLLMLTIWFLGPIGVLLVVLGAGRTRLTRLLTAGILVALGVTLFHDDYGLHIVGPIHYSETAMPLAVLAIHGAHRLWGGLDRLDISRETAAVTLGVGLVLSLGSFTAWHARALQQQSEIHATVYGLFDDPEFDNSVVLAPQYAAVWQHLPDVRETGSFVFDWRRVSPDRSESTIILHDHPDLVPTLREDYPERTFFRLTLHSESPRVRLRRLPLEPSSDS